MHVQLNFFNIQKYRSLTHFVNLYTACLRSRLKPCNVRNFVQSPPKPIKNSSEIKHQNLNASEILRGKAIKLNLASPRRIENDLQSESCLKKKIGIQKGALYCA